MLYYNSVHFQIRYINIVIFVKKNLDKNKSPVYFEYAGPHALMKTGNSWIIRSRFSKKSRSASPLLNFQNGDSRSPLVEKTLATVFPNGNAFLSVRRYEDEDECKSGKAPCANSEDYACINRLDGYSCVPKLLRNDIKIKFNAKKVLPMLNTFAKRLF